MQVSKLAGLGLLIIWAFNNRRVEHRQNNDRLVQSTQTAFGFLTPTENMKCSISLHPCAVINLNVFTVLFVFIPICSVVLHFSGSLAGTCEALTSPHILLVSEGRPGLDSWSSMCCSAVDCGAHWDKGKCVCVWERYKCVKYSPGLCSNSTQAALGYMQWINMAVCQVAANSLPYPFGAYLNIMHKSGSCLIMF